MKYSFEFKMECVRLYHEGKRPESPEGITRRNFRHTIRLWGKLEEFHGPEILKYGKNIPWTPEQKFEDVSQVLSGRSLSVVAIENGINPGQLCTWVNR